MTNLLYLNLFILRERLIHFNDSNDGISFRHYLFLHWEKIVTDCWREFFVIKTFNERFWTFSDITSLKNSFLVVYICNIISRIYRSYKKTFILVDSCLNINSFLNPFLLYLFHSLNQSLISFATFLRMLRLLNSI